MSEGKEGTLDLWYLNYCTQKELSDQEIENTLRKLNLRFAKLGDTKQGVGILFCSNTYECEKLCTTIYEVFNHHSCRLIIIFVGCAQIPSHQAWKILQTGISNIYFWKSCPNWPELIQNQIARWNLVEKYLGSNFIKHNLVGESPCWQKILHQVIEVGLFTDASVLVTGESGTGKEMVARLIHYLDPREQKKQLTLLDCSTIVPELSGSEFFGHERGAFTNAVASRDGAFALADQGTLFLDEVGELPMPLQAGLLRVIQEGTYKRVGSNNWRKSEFRLVCATNRNLLEEVNKGNFRHDLYHRVSTWVFALPPLHERRQDIPSLAKHFLKKHCGNRPAPPIDPMVMEYLTNRDYSGNVRELNHLMKRLLLKHLGTGPIMLGDIPETDRPELTLLENHWRDEGFPDAIQKAVLTGTSLKEIKEIAADTAIDIALEHESGIVKKAAERLGITDRALQMRLAARKQQEKTSSNGNTY